MSSLMSTVKEVADLYIDQLPSGKPINVKKAIRVKNITVIMDEHGNLYCNHLQRYHYGFGVYPWTDSLMRALVKIGAITKGQMNEHIKECQKRDAAREERYDTERLAKLVEKYGADAVAKQIAVVAKQ